MGRREAKQSANRERLATAALIVFSREGYHGASLADVAAEAGLTKGAVYSNFTSKRALLLHALTRSSERWFGYAEMPMPAMTVPDVLAALARAYTDRVQPDEHLVRQLGLSHDLLSLMVRDVDGSAAIADARTLGHVILARTLVNVAEADGTREGRSMSGVAIGVMAMMSAMAQGRGLDPASFSVDLATQAAAALAGLDDPVQDRPSAPGETAASDLVVSALPLVDDLVRGGPVNWDDDPTMVVLVPLGGGDQLRGAVDSIRATNPRVNLVVVVTVPAGQEDIASYIAWTLPDLTMLLRAAVPEDHLADLALTVDIAGDLSTALHVDRGATSLVALGVQQNRVVVHGSGPEGAAGVAGWLSTSGANI